jgi:AcrR family transcriptional regulator
MDILTPVGAGSLRERKKQQTRDRCVAAALRLFRERGYEGATVELIAAEADCSVTTFFRYFKAKEDAFLASFLALQERFERALRDRPSGVPVLTALRAIVSEVVREFTEHAEGRDHLKAFESVPELHDRIREYQDRSRQIVTAAFADELGVDTTDLRPQMLAGAVVGAFESARNAWLEGPRDVPLHDHMMRAFDLVERMSEPILQGPAVSRRRDP